MIINGHVFTPLIKEVRMGTNNMEEKSKKMSLKVVLTGLVMLSLILIGALITILAVVNLRRGMEDEVEQGVKATCQT